MFSITKRYRDYPFSHRQHGHAGHCSHTHGHSWRFDITLTCDKLDDNGMVFDFGKMTFIKEFLDQHFDHTTVLNDTDPWLEYMKFHLEDVTDPAKPQNGCVDLARIVSVPNCGAEGIAQFIHDQVTVLFRKNNLVTRGVRVYKVKVYEDSRNSATYKPHRAFRA